MEANSQRQLISLGRISGYYAVLDMTIVRLKLLRIDFHIEAEAAFSKKMRCMAQELKSMHPKFP